jgi:hypothetical protein
MALAVVILVWPVFGACWRKPGAARWCRPMRERRMSEDIQQEGTLLVTREDAVATIVLNRPAKLNAFTLDMWRQLGEAFRALSADDTVRCVIVRGAGERRFRRATTSASSPPRVPTSSRPWPMAR